MDGVAHRLLEPDNLIKFNLDGSMTCTAGQVAHLLGMSSRTFDRQRPELKKAGFPEKLPGTGKWSRPAVVAWISSNGAPTVATPRGIDNGDPEIEAIVTGLEREYGKGRAA